MYCLHHYRKTIHVLRKSIVKIFPWTLYLYYTETKQRIERWRRGWTEDHVTCFSKGRNKQNQRSSLTPWHSVPPYTDSLPFSSPPCHHLLITIVWGNTVFLNRDMHKFKLYILSYIYCYISISSTPVINTFIFSNSFSSPRRLPLGCIIFERYFVALYGAYR